MDLDAIIDSVVPPASRGRRQQEVHAQVRRELNASDVERLWALPEGGLGSTAAPLQKIGFSHHSLAKLLAEGRSNADCSLITGKSPSRISILKHDPAMTELIEYYKTQNEAVYLNIHERLATLGLSSIEELQDRLDTDPNSFSQRELMELAALGFDRSGYGPSSKVQHEHAHFLKPADVSRIKSDVAGRQNGTVRQINPQSSEWPQVGGTVIDGSLGEAAAAEGSKGEGNNLSEPCVPTAPEEVPSSRGPGGAAE